MGLCNSHRPERALVLLLVRLQSRYAPLIKGTLTKSTSTLVFDPEVGDHVDPFHDTVRSFDPRGVLEELGLTVKNIEDFQRWLGVHGHVNDPVEHWHMLLRMTSYREREKLRDGARRAHDAYDAAEILRRFYHDLTGELLPNPDEIFDISDKSWKKRVFGRWPFLSYTRRDLQAELRRHDLWPHHIHLVVEGPTEEILCRRIIEDFAGRPVEDLGMTLATLGGVGKARLHQEMLRITSVFARWAILVADREGDIERDAELMRREGILSEDTCVLWEHSFEEDNFTDNELVAILADLASEAGVSLDLDGKRFRSAYDKHRSHVGAKAKGALTYLSAVMSCSLRSKIGEATRRSRLKRAARPWSTVLLRRSSRSPGRCGSLGRGRRRSQVGRSASVPGSAHRMLAWDARSSSGPALGGIGETRRTHR